MRLFLPNPERKRLGFFYWPGLIRGYPAPAGSRQLHDNWIHEMSKTPLRVEATLEAARARSIPQAAKLAGFGRSKMFAEIKAGRLRAVKLGSRTLIRDVDLAAYLQGLPTTDEFAAMGR